MRVAQIYQRTGKLYLVPYARTTTRGLVNSEPIGIANSTDDDEQVGSKVMAALDAFREGVPHPVDWKAVLEPLLRAVGVRSNSSFVRGTKSAVVRIEDEKIEVVPTRNMGANGGFIDIKDSAIVLHSGSAQEIGEAVKKALGAST